MTRCYERKFRIPAKSTSRLTLEAPVLGLRQLWISQDTFQISPEALLVQTEMSMGSQLCLCP